MIDGIIKQWDKRKHILEEHFRTNNPYYEYKDIVRLLFELVITDAPYWDRDDPNWDNAWDYDNIDVIDNGSYQGTLIFLIHTDVYQPEVS